MSWLFSQALVEEYSAAICLDGEPFAQLNVMPTPQPFWRNDKMMDASDLSLFGLTSRLLTEQDGEALLMSYLGAFPARTLVQQEKGKGSTASGQDCGRTWRGSFAKYSPELFLWKTAQCSLLEGLEEFSETWPRWGSMRNGASYLRQIPALPICASASGLWPTPTVYGNNNQPGMSAKAGWELAAAAKLWTTPSASDAKRGGTITDRMTGTSLAQQVNTPSRWPTPNASDANKWSNQTLAERKAKGQQVRISTAVSPQGGMGGQLNPEWVEWLMGWPIGWTELKPLATDRFQEWRQQHRLSYDGADEAA